MPGPGRRWKKGESGNPTGRTKLPKELRDIRKHTVKDIRDMISVLMHATTAEVEALVDDLEAPILEKIMAQVLIKTYESGNFQTLDQVLNRVIGKVKERLAIDDDRPERQPRTLEELKALSLAIRNRGKK